MEQVKHDLLTSKYTKVFHEPKEEMQHNAPHFFKVVTNDNPNDPREVGEVLFQCGPIGEVGVNGVMNEDLIAMVITRLEHFNNSEFRCRENAMAITKLEESLMWLRKRTMGRENRGVEGTHTV